MVDRSCVTALLCVLALVTIITLIVSCSRQPVGSSNLILITVDALRADAVDLGGGPNSPTPSIARLAGRSVCFENAISSFVGTTASMPSLMTGLLPNLIDVESWNVATWHGFSDLNDPDEVRGLTRNLRTLAEILRDRGYLTAGFSNNANISRKVDFDQGFLYWEDFWDYLAPLRATRQHPMQYAYTPADVVITHVNDWLQANAEQPFFLWFHLMETHWPYLPPEPFQRLPGRQYSELDDLELNQRLRDFQQGHRDGPVPDPEERYKQHIKALYDGEVRFVDAQLGRLLGLLEQLDLMERSVIVLTADHGEELFDHGFSGHHFRQPPLEELIRIPLLISLPQQFDRRGGRSIGQLVRMIDLAPTMLDFLGAGDAISAMDGVSLRPLIAGRSQAEQPAFISSIPFHTVRTRRWKYHLVKQHTGRFPPGEVLIDLAADPLCAHNVAAQHPEILAQLRAEHDRTVAHLRQRSSAHGARYDDDPGLDAEEREMLRDLGYVE